MALQVVQSMDNNEVLSGQPIAFTLTVTNPLGGTACNITGIAPRLTVSSGGPGAYNIGRPLLSIPEAPAFINAGSSLVFTWKECLFVGQQPQAQANTPAGATALSSIVDIFCTDSTGVYTSNTSVLYIYPNVGVNQNTAVAPDPAGAFFAKNQNSWLIALMSAAVPL